jgi:hypothetical protein
MNNLKYILLSFLCIVDAGAFALGPARFTPYAANCKNDTATKYWCCPVPISGHINRPTYWVFSTHASEAGLTCFGQRLTSCHSGVQVYDPTNPDPNKRLKGTLNDICAGSGIDF